MTIRYIIFDADNTLYKSKEAATSADEAVFNMIAKKTGKKPEEIFDIFWNKIIPSVKDAVIPFYRNRRYGYSLLLKELGIFDVKYTEELYNTFIKKEIETIELFNETRDVLAELKAAGYTLILFTEEEKELFDMKSRKFGLDPIFSKMITSSHIGMMKNAGVEAYNAFIIKAGVKPKFSIMVGDSISNDMKPASELGFITILVDRKGDKEKGYSDYDIRNLREISHILDEAQ